MIGFDRKVKKPDTLMDLGYPLSKCEDRDPVVSEMGRFIDLDGDQAKIRGGVPRNR